jgi:hypothetical protein
MAVARGISPAETAVRTFLGAGAWGTLSFMDLFGLSLPNGLASRSGVLMIALPAAIRFLALRVGDERPWD